MVQGLNFMKLVIKTPNYFIVFGTQTKKFGFWTKESIFTYWAFNIPRIIWISKAKPWCAFGCFDIVIRKGK